MNERGFTLLEIIVVVFFFAIIAAIAFPLALNQIEKAKLARCMADLRTIQAEVWQCTPDGLIHPHGMDFWNCAYGGTKPGPFVYLVDGDPNAGHGNDIDGIDEENPGESWKHRDRKDIKFVVLCQHNHKFLGDYVYCVDEEPPVVVGGEDGAPDPNYTRFIKYEFGGPGGGKDKSP